MSDHTTEATVPAPDPDPTTDPGGAAVPVSVAVARLEKRMNLLIGVIGVLLVGAFLVIGLLLGRVAEAERTADALRADLAAGVVSGGGQTRLDSLEADLERVEAGAELYASQIDGFREQLVELSPELEAGLDEAVAGLREFGDSTIAFDVEIDETIPIDTEVVINRTVEVPIVTEIPINEEIETTIEVGTPFGGVPVDVTVPVNLAVPIDLVVDIPINETVPISDEFPVQLSVPIEIDVGETELATLTDSLATGLESLQAVLTGLA